MKTRVQRLKNNKGFTLLELLIALAVLAIGLLGIAGMMISAIQGNAFGGKMSMAENLASQRLEFFKNLGYGSITREIGLAGCAFGTSGASTCGAGTATENYGEVDCGNATYSRFIRETTMQFLNYADPNNPTPAENCALEDSGNPKLITVTVQWVDSTNTTRTVRMMEVFAK